VVVPDPILSYSLAYSAMKTLENTAQDPHDPEPADEGYIKMEYSSD
jgi:hypothetical protein